MKLIKSGRGTGKTTETVGLMLKNKNLFTVIPNINMISSYYNVFDNFGYYRCAKNEIVNDVLKRIITPKDIPSIKRSYPNAEFHIEEVEQILSNILNINFNTMTTSHWTTESFRRGEIE